MIVRKSYSINRKLSSKTQKSKTSKSKKSKSKKSKSRKQKNRLSKKSRISKRNKGNKGNNLVIEHNINSNSKTRNHSSITHSKSTRARIVQFNQRNQYGGTNCELATVSEPGFNLPDSGGITGLNIGEARGILYRPNCKADTYQAMVPP